MTITAIELRHSVVEDTRRYLGRGRAALAEFVAAPVEVFSEGSLIHTSDGRALVDCGGYAVFLFGHRPPTVVEAVKRQLDTHPLATRLLLEPVIADAARALLSIAPEGLNKVQFLSTGAEAVELAIKIGRIHGKRHLVSFAGGFHGKTTGALSVTANRQDQEPFAPLLNSTALPFGDLAALEAELVAHRGDSIVFVEPIQGEGGVRIPEHGFLAGVESLTREHGAFLVVDEIQSGLGRTGRMWAHQSEIRRPDILLAGKALSGGVVPVSAVMATDASFAPFSDDPTLHSSTFGGSPLAGAAVRAVVDLLADPATIETVDRLGVRLLADVRSAVSHSDHVVDVRGRGLLLAIEFDRPDLAAEIVADLLRRGVIVNHSLTNNTVVRLTPPITLTEPEYQLVVTAIGEAITALVVHD